MAFRLLKFGVKAGLASGAVYYTVDQGVWKDSDHTAQLYLKMYETLSPLLNESPIEVSQLPKAEEISYFAQHYWNKGVIASCLFIEALPSNIVDWSKAGYEMASEQLQKQTVNKDTKL